jgi:hypothetical protein
VTVRRERSNVRKGIRVIRFPHPVFYLFIKESEQLLCTKHNTRPSGATELQKCVSTSRRVYSVGRAMDVTRAGRMLYKNVVSGASLPSCMVVNEFA